MKEIGTIHWKRFEKFLLESECQFKREQGDHRVYTRPGLKRPIILPRYKELPSFIILNNLKLLGISKKDFLKTIH